MNSRLQEKKNYLYVGVGVFLAGLFFVLRAAHADPINIGAPSFVSSKDPASFVSGLYAYALSMAGVLAVIMIVYGGIKYVASGGNESAKSDALDIIKNAIFGIVLLFGGYIILYTINPNLVNIKNPTVPNAPSLSTLGSPPTSTGAPPTSTPPTNPGGLSSTTQALAQQVLASGLSFSSDADCTPGSDASGVINAMASGQFPLVCNCYCRTGGSACVAGGPSGNVAVSDSLLSDLIQIGGKFPGAVVTSLTGGVHSCSNDSHYQGKAADISPSPPSADLWQNAVTYINGLGATAHCECPPGNFVKSCSACFPGGQRMSGAHIHFQVP